MWSDFRSSRSRHCERSEACVDGPCLQGLAGDFSGCVRLRACVRPVGAARAAGQDGFRGGRSKQSSDLDRPLLRAVYVPLRIERSRPSLRLLQGREAELERCFEPADLVRRQRWPRRGARSARRSPSASRRSAPSCWRARPPRAWRACVASSACTQPDGFLRRPADLPDHRSRPDDEQAAQHRIAGARDAPRPRLAGGRMVARRQPEPGGEVAPRFEEMAGPASSSPGARRSVGRRRGSLPSAARRLVGVTPVAQPPIERRDPPQSAACSSASSAKSSRANAGTPAPARRSRSGPIPAGPLAATRPNSAAWPRIALTSCVRWRTRRSRWPASIRAACSSVDFAGTKRMCGRLAASHSAAASAASFLPRAT